MMDFSDWLNVNIQLLWYLSFTNPEEEFLFWADFERPLPEMFSWLLQISVEEEGGVWEPCV